MGGLGLLPRRNQTLLVELRDTRVPVRSVSCV
jgi:hypothetical protein